MNTPEQQTIAEIAENVPNMLASEPDATAPVLIFDTGMGGLSILKPLLQSIPDAPIVYAADYAGMPYGQKTEAEVAARVPAILGRLVERVRPRIVVIACNTASVVALSHVRAALDVPVVGTVPAIKPAAAISKTRVIGVLGTKSTIRQPYVDRLVAEFAADCIVLRHGAPDLVNVAEAKLRGEAVDMHICAESMAGLTNQPSGDRMDVCVLACTHFPLLEGELAQDTLPDMQFVDGGAGIARRVAHLTGGQNWPAVPKRSAIFTGRTAAHDAYLPALRAFGIDEISAL
jgi:glutamate racemase